MLAIGAELEYQVEISR